MNIDSNEEMICGLNAISQIIKTRPKSVKILFVTDSPNERLKGLIKLTEELNIKVEKQNTSFFDKNFEGINHQNIALRCNKRSEETENYLELILEKDEVKLLILDGLTDPHNVGACLRSAAAAMVDAVIVPKNRACHLTPTVRKISCGASELIPFIIVTNLVRTISLIKKKGILVFGSDLQATKFHSEVVYSKRNALIVGSEDKGIRRLTRENCDELIKIDMSNNIDSLNASVSTGILLFEISRQNKIKSN
jgi:23S rRNA (guanosine2251-2'-O)-methyltransferase